MNLPLSHALEPMLRKLQQWKTLEPTDRAAVLALPHTVERPERGRHIIRDGDRRPTPAC